MEWITLAWKFRNEIAIGLIVIVLGLAGLYIRHVFQDRNDLQEQVKILRQDLEAVKKQVTLNEDIANAIRKIKIQSNNYVSVVETGVSPPVDSVSTLVNAGVFLPAVYKAHSSSNKPSGNEGSAVGPQRAR